jgi:nucleoside 2-deoxyribosyltransferase
MKSVVICGSRRYKDGARAFAAKLRAKGVVVFEPFFNTNKDIDKLASDLKRYAFSGLTWHHFEFIRKADVVFIYNKDGYMGNSATMELGAAAVLGKPIYALEEDKTEACRNVLIDEVINTPEKLVKRLK